MSLQDPSHSFPTPKPETQALKPPASERKILANCKLAFAPTLLPHMTEEPAGILRKIVSAVNMRAALWLHGWTSSETQLMGSYMSDYAPCMK